MSTNYNILLKSEKKLKKLLFSYLFHVYEIHQKLWRDTEKYIGQNENLILDNIERRLKRSSDAEDELLDECIWTISKDDPRANHLRFIIFIIYSTKDLSRACEYTQSIGKIIVRNNFSKKTIDIIKPLFKLYLKHIEQIIELHNDEMENFNLENFDDLTSQFEEKFEEIQKEIKKQFSNDEFIHYKIMQIERLISSTIERIQSTFSFALLSKMGSTITIGAIKKSK
ncbi:MAG: hypothetical protein IKG09_01360 [Mycoplasmataceae bacterium]|nr:hypothetical protein [Mycoplasmataceae bacterium]